MSIFHAIVLGIVQGLTEFLPISSSGHLLLIPELFGWTELTKNPDVNRAFDVALHMGTLLATISYFRRDLGQYLAAGAHSLRTRTITTTEERVAWLLVISVVPGAIAGVLFDGVIADYTSGPIVVAVMLILFGLLLGYADRLPVRRPFSSLGPRDGWKLGAAQAVALQPGVSRSGIAITAGRATGLDRDAATRVSFLMLVPIVTAAAVFTGLKIIGDGFPAGFGGAFLAGTIASAVTGYLAIGWLLRYLRTRGFGIFVVYRVMVGTAAIIWFTVR